MMIENVCVSFWQGVSWMKDGLKTRYLVAITRLARLDLHRQYLFHAAVPSIGPFHLSIYLSGIHSTTRGHHVYGA